MFSLLCIFAFSGLPFFFFFSLKVYKNLFLTFSHFTFISILSAFSSPIVSCCLLFH